MNEKEIKPIVSEANDKDLSKVIRDKESEIEELKKQVKVKEADKEKADCPPHRHCPICLGVYWNPDRQIERCYTCRKG